MVDDDKKSNKRKRKVVARRKRDKNKPIEEKLTPRQELGIYEANGGDDRLLIKCCLECLEGRQKAITVQGVVGDIWSKGMIEHYESLFDYLLTKLSKDESRRLVFNLSYKHKDRSNGQ